MEKMTDSKQDEQEDKKTMWNFDELITEIGEMGRYQLFVYVLLCISSIPMAFRTNISVFITPTIDYRCAIPPIQQELNTVTDDEFVPKSSAISMLLNETVPRDYNNATCTHIYSKCSQYGYNSSDQVPCESWVFDKSTFTQTAIEEYKLVCEWSEWRTYTMMAPMIGMLVGSIVFGTLSDRFYVATKQRFGRKRVFVVNTVIVIIVDILVAWAPNLAYYTVYKFLSAGISMGMYLAIFVLGVELMGPSKRMWAGIVINLFWAIGVSLLAGIAYGIRDWHFMQLTSALPSILFISYIWLIPESPRWLLTKGRRIEAMEVIEKIAKHNNTKVPKRFYDVSVPIDQNENVGKLWQLCQNPRLAIRSTIIVVNWIAVTLAYYGLLLHSGNMSGNIFLNFFLSSIVEYIGYFLCLVLLDRIGRRILHTSSMLLSGVACICSIFPVVFADIVICKQDDDGPNIATLALSMIGRLGASAGFATIYIFSSELFPTSLRNGAMGFSSMVARIGGIAAPYVANLNVGGKFGKALPLLIFGAFTTVAGLLSLALPETLNQKLPETIEDAERFGRKKSNTHVAELAFNKPVTLDDECTRF